MGFYSNYFILILYITNSNNYINISNYNNFASIFYRFLPVLSSITSIKADSIRPKKVTVFIVHTTFFIYTTEELDVFRGLVSIVLSRMRRGLILC